LRKAICDHSVVDIEAHLQAIHAWVERKSGAAGTEGKPGPDLTPVESTEAEQAVKQASASTRRAATPPHTSNTETLL
jgi:hypothetical protein